MLYGKASAEIHTEALNALESCLSASHVDVQAGYAHRLEPHKYPLLEILGFFEKEGQEFEHTQLMRLLVNMFDGSYFTGFQINDNQRLIDMMRKRIKGKLIFTRSVLADKDKNPNTAKKNFARFKLGEESNDAQA